MASGSGWNLWVWLAGGGCGWNLWVWLVGVVVRRYIDFLSLLLLYLFFFAADSLIFVHFWFESHLSSSFFTGKEMFRFVVLPCFDF